MGPLINSFFNDQRVQIALLVIVLDLGLGLIASAKTKKFRLSFISDVLRNDVLFKILPFFLLYGGYKYAGGADIVIPGVDLEVLMNAAWGIILLALGGSILSSLKELGLLSQAPDSVAGPDPNTPL